MKKEKVLFSAPPRLLLGVSFLFWGAMHDRPLPALIAAILMEGRHWTNLRWKFGENGFARSWQLSVLVLIIAAIGLLQIEDREAADFLSLLSWLPFIMLPLALAQQYSSDPGVPLTTFSFITRRKMAADRRAGRETNVREVQLGYPYFFLILIESGMGVGNILGPGRVELHYTLGVALLLAWALLALKEGKVRWGAWGGAYVLSILAMAGMTWGMISAYRAFVKSFSGPSEQPGSPFETQTSIGQVGKLQLSPTIRWRYYHEKGAVPNLVRLSSYNWPEGNLWRARMRRRTQQERIEEWREVGGDFEKFIEVGEHSYVFNEDDRKVADFLTRGEIVGIVSDQELIPHPLRTRRLEEVQTEILSANSMGAIQLNSPKQAAMKVQLFADDRLKAVEHDPSVMDLRCPSLEEEGLDHFLFKLGLEPVEWKSRVKVEREGTGESDRRQVKAKKRTVDRANPEPPKNVTEAEFFQVQKLLKESFFKDFTYTSFLTEADLGKPMSEFVNKKRVGHCEYFGGATALLLRRMGIPSRYVVGFAVSERGSGEGEYLLRGQHAHAWAQAYVGGEWVDEAKEGRGSPLWRCRGGRWVNVDLTPGSWLSGIEGNPWYQGVLDWFQKVKARLLLWFARPSIASGLMIFLLVVGTSFLIYLIYKLVKTRGRDERAGPGSWEERVRIQGEVRDFERWLARRVGPRPASMPMASWLRDHLPEKGGHLIARYEEVTFQTVRTGNESLKGEIQKAKELWQKAQKTLKLEKTSG